MRVDDGVVEQAPIETVLIERKEDANQVKAKPTPQLTKEFSFMDKPANKRTAKAEKKVMCKENT